MSVLGTRLKQARTQAGLSQEQLGIEAGLDPMSASTRMNRYELGHRAANFELVEAFAKVLNIPTPYFYARDQQLASLLLAYGRMKPAERARLLETAELAAGNQPRSPRSRSR